LSYVEAPPFFEAQPQSRFSERRVKLVLTLPSVEIFEVSPQRTPFLSPSPFGEGWGEAFLIPLPLRGGPG